MNYNDEMNGVELAIASATFRKCEHELVSKTYERYTHDARRQLVKQTTCKKCGLYNNIEILEEDKVKDEWI